MPRCLFTSDFILNDMKKEDYHDRLYLPMKSMLIESFNKEKISEYYTRCFIDYCPTSDKEAIKVTITEGRESDIIHRLNCEVFYDK